MSEDKAYKDGDIVWVKLGNNWWPGEVTGPTRHPEGLLKHLKRVPYCVVKFFNENTYEYVRSSKQIFPFQSPKHDEFIKKGYSLYNSGNSFMEKFPADVEVAEQLIRRRESSLVINDRPDSIVKAILGQPLVRTYDECYDSSVYREKRRSGDSVTKILNITPNRDNDALSSQQSRVQKCDFCDFTSVRLNVMILHRKIHSNRNIFGSTKSASKLTPNKAAKTVTDINVESINKVQQNHILNNEKSSKAKVNTITATDGLLLETPSPPRIASRNKNNTSISSNYVERTAEISTIGKKNGNLTTAQNKSRCTKNASSDKEPKEENAYNTILLDFCPSETELSPQSEEKASPQSAEKSFRRSLRHCKDMTLTATDKDSTVYTDLSETKTIRKIPKKREYSTSHMEKDSTSSIISPVVFAESDKEQQPAATSLAVVHSDTSKRDAEDIHRMLLADWSDDDETPVTIFTDISTNLENSNINDRVSAPLKEFQDFTAIIASSMPSSVISKPSSVMSGRIRNIPKKDRRDIVLQDFNSDVSFDQIANDEQVVKDQSVDLESSNSSVVEIMEEHPAAVITINDDDDPENSKLQINHTDVLVRDGKDDGSCICFINNKSVSTAKSTTILSCFDFQEDEDEHENAASTISHFKKKYLSGEQQPSLSLTTSDDLEETNVSKSRSELAEKDQRLAADIETLLEETRPKISDLLSASSFEETFSVKDLPIKERGKRIFKSRNKIRMEDKVNSAPAAVSIPTEEQTSEGCTYKSTEIMGKKQSETVPEQSAVDKEVAICNHEVLNRNCFVKVSGEKILSSFQTEIPRLLENEQLSTNDKKDNKTESKPYQVCSAVSIYGINSCQGKQLKNEKSVENSYERDHYVYSNQQCKQLQDEQQDIVNQCQESLSTLEKIKVPRQKDILITESIQKSGEIVEHIESNKSLNALIDNQNNHTEDVMEKVRVDRVKVLEVQIFKQTQEYFKNKETAVDNSANEMVFRKGKQELQIVDSEPNFGNSKVENQKQFTETTFKIRVKSPEQLLDQAYVMSSQQEPELKTVSDVSVDLRLASATPTDENSSMGASDTGAEFGSPTSMLSEERLPAFRFQTNKTPQKDVETTGSAEPKIENLAEAIQERSDECSDKNTNRQKENPEIYQGHNQKSLRQRRYSMDLNSLQTERKLTKRQRLSVDCETRNQENHFEKVEEKSHGIDQRKPEGNVRPKSRHMKITPRRNVSELFKEHIDKYITADAKKKFLMESLKATKSVNDTVSMAENKPLVDNINITPVNEVAHELAEKLKETDPQDNENPNLTSNNIDLSKTTLEKASENETLNTELYKLSDENEKNRDYVGDNGEAKNEKGLNCNSDVHAERSDKTFLSKETATDLKSIEETLIDREENQQIQLNPKHFHKNTEFQKSIKDMENQSILNESIIRNSNPKEQIGEDSTGNAYITAEVEKSMHEHSGSISDMMTLLNNSGPHTEQILEIPFSPGIPPSTPQESEVVIETENLNTIRNTQQEVQDKGGEKSKLTLHNKDTENLHEMINQKKEQILREMDESSTIDKESESIIDANDQRITSLNEKSVKECETAELIKLPTPLHMVIEFENNFPMSCTPGEINDEDECENLKQMPTASQPKDLIIEIEPATPQGIIECDPNLAAHVAFEKEVIIENDIVIENPTKQDIIEENLQLEEGETLLEREFQVIEPKDSSVPVSIPSVPETNSVQIDADKAAEEFLIEFDNIVNHSHIVEEGEQSRSVEDAINAEDLINNIIEEVHEDHQLKQDALAKSVSTLQCEPLATYTVVAHKNSWNQIFKDSFNTQLNPVKRRKTICFEISDTKEGVACKKHAFDFESILPVNKTIKRTAERKLTMPTIESKLTNSHQPHNILSLNHSQLSVNKKLIPTAKRKLSIEDNIASFVIERPKQLLNAVIGPPPLQRIRPLRRQSNLISKSTLDNMPELPPLQSQENLFNDLFKMESSSSLQSLAAEQKAESERMLHQSIISGPAAAISSVSQNKSIEPKISMNKQIGVDSRGNKYVIIKTPPTDIIVQPTLTATTASAVPATNNLGTSITIQPITRSSSEIITTKNITKNKNISKQQLQQQSMKQISNTTPTKSPLEISNLPEISAKTASRNRRKAVQTKAITATNSNINSAKHRQAIEALSRRLSITSETPTLAKISRTSSANVQTQLSSNSSLSSLFVDAQITNIAQQQLIQLQQQTTRSTPSPPPPIVLNKNAHQQSVIQRKTRKITSQQQTQLKKQQTATAKSTQQQNPIQHQSQEIQPQFITQILQQPQTQEHNPFQPPTLQQLQPLTLPTQQQMVQQSDGVLITAEDDNVIDSISQLIALPTQPYPGYSETFLLCKVKGNTCKPVDNVPLYLNHQLNELVPVPLEAIESGNKTPEHQIKKKTSDVPQHLLGTQNNEPLDNEGNIQIANLNCNLAENEISAVIESETQMNQNSQIMEECAGDESRATVTSNQINEFGGNQVMNTELVSNNGILLNIEGQQVLLDAATFAHLLANPDANTQLISDDGTEYVLTHEVLAALQIQQEQQQALELGNAAAEQQHNQHLEQTASNDIIAVALASSDLYDNDVLTIDTSQGMQLIEGDGSSIVFPSQTGSITQQHLTPPAVVTNAVLDQSPIMSALEVPSSISSAHKLQGNQLITVPSHHLAESSNVALSGRSNLEDSLAAIGVTTQSSSIPSSLGLPITVTNPNIASKVTSVGPLNEMLQFVAHRPTTAAATAAAVAAAALAGESRIFTD